MAAEDRPDSGGALDIVTSSVRRVPSNAAHPVQRVAIYGCEPGSGDDLYRPRVSTLDAETGEVLCDGFANDPAISGLDELRKESVSSVRCSWGLSDSQGTPPQEWSGAAPQVPWGSALWVRTTVTMADGRSSSSSACVSGPSKLAASGCISLSVGDGGDGAASFGLDAGDGLSSSGSGSISVDGTVARKTGVEASCDWLSDIEARVVEGAVAVVTGKLSRSVRKGETLSISAKLGGTHLYSTPGWSCSSDGASITATAAAAFAPGSDFKCVMVC